MWCRAWSTRQDEDQKGKKQSSSTLRQTHLVVNLGRGILELDSLLEYAALLVELDALGPVVEGTGNVDFVSGVLPERRVGSAECLRQDRNVEGNWRAIADAEPVSQSSLQKLKAESSKFGARTRECDARATVLTIDECCEAIGPRSDCQHTT